MRAITEETQQVDAEYGSGRWQWEVYPEEAGDFTLLLAITPFAADGKTAVGKADGPKNLLLHSKGTFAYYAGEAWKGIQSVVSSLQVVTLAVAAIFGAIAGGFVKRGKPP